MGSLLNLISAALNLVAASRPCRRGNFRSIPGKALGRLIYRRFAFSFENTSDRVRVPGAAERHPGTA